MICPLLTIQLLIIQFTFLFYPNAEKPSNKILKIRRETDSIKPLSNILITIQKILTELRGNKPCLRRKSCPRLMKVSLLKLKFARRGQCHSTPLTKFYLRNGTS